MITNPYLDPLRVRAALRAIDVRPSREMGQNFLIDSQALAAIVAAAELTSADTVVEVGPGLGVLTWELLRQAGRVISVELDRRLATRLEEEFATEARFSLLQSDILRIEPGEILRQENLLHSEHTSPDTSALGQEATRSLAAPEQAYKVVANLPYAITSAALRHFLEAAHKPSMIVVLVQWEVAERICAKPGDLSVLAHSVQMYAQPEIVARVPASSFVPAPAVDSAILRLRLYPRPATDLPPDALLRLIKAGFLQARKKISNALPNGLASQGKQLPKEQALAALATANIDAGRRAETLTLEEWGRLYYALGFHIEQEEAAN